MIIIKIDEENRDESTNISIASILFNMELGCKAFNSEGEIDDPDEDFHVVEKDGISYAIRGVIGNIVVLHNRDYKQYNISLSRDLDNFLRILDYRYFKYRKEGIPYYTGKSLDYTLVSELRDNSTDRRNIVHKSDIRPSSKFRFTWSMVSEGNKILSINDSNKVHCRDLNEYNHLVHHNTLVIDARNVFESKEKITFINGIPSKSDYSMSNRFVSYYVFTYSEKYGGIDSVLRRLKNPTDNQEMQDIIIKDMFIPVYEEEWENINPMRVVCRDNNPITEHIYGLLTSSYNYTLMELEEVKNVASGAPPAPNNVCHSCDMYLYGMIYVLELKDNHVCVCSKCLHDSIYPEMFDNFNCADVNVLKVMYPKTVVDIIGIIDMSDEFRSLMIELSGDVTINDDVITTPNYVGYNNIDNILLKTVTPPEDKKLFVCKILS